MSLKRCSVPVVLTLFFAAASFAFAGGQKEASGGTQPKVAPAIHVLINASPWLSSFQKVVALYEDETGRKVVLDVTPFPSLLQKTRNATTAPTSEYDVVALTEGWAALFYQGGLVTPFKTIDPGFKLSSQVIEYGYADRWNATAKTTAKGGEIYGLPFNGNIELLFYRKDLFAQKGLTPPSTFAQLLADAKALADPPKIYGFTVRTSDDPVFDFQPFLYGYGGSIVSYDGATGTWSVDIDKKPALDALDYWLNLAWSFDPADYTQVSQSTMISLMASGRSAMAIMVAAAVSNLNNPKDSSVIGKIGAAVVPGLTPGRRAPASGIAVLAIPHNLPMSHQKAALGFISWLATKKAEEAYANADGLPVRQDVYETMAKNAKFWWAPAIAASTPYISHFPRVVPGGEMKFMLDDILRQVVAKQLSPEAAMKKAAASIYSEMKKAGYPMAPLHS